MISPEQIRAGRALLGWSGRELASAADVSLNTIQRLELGHVAIRSASVDTLDKITRALEGAGIVFLADGYGVTKRQLNP